MIGEELMKFKKSLCSSVVIFSSIIFYSILNEIISNFILSLMISIFIEVLILDIYYLLFNGKLSLKFYLSASISMIGLFICLFNLFTLLISLMLMFLVIINFCSLSYIINEKNRISNLGV